MTTIYIFRVGNSADGETLHPSEADPEDGLRFSDLEKAQREGDRLAARPLNWARNQANDTWVAILGDGRVAEISRGVIPDIHLNVGLMD